MTAVATKANSPLKLNFKDDTLTTASRDTLRAIARKLGFNETQAALYAIARLRDEVLVDKETEQVMPLTKQEHEAIAKAAPKKRGKVLASLL
jgi:hypothetical protein